MSELIDVLNMIVQDNTKANKQTDIVYGTVSSIAPLTVKLDDTMLPVPDVALVLTENVKSRSAKVQGGGGGTVVINEGLAIGDKVVMLRVSHGSRYIILSRV